MNSHQDTFTKIEDEALEFYSSVTGNPIRESDRQLCQELLKNGLAPFKVGVLLSVARCKTHVNSLRYCAGAIEEAAQHPQAGSDSYIRYLTEKIRQIAGAV